MSLGGDNGVEKKRPRVRKGNAAGFDPGVEPVETENRRSEKRARTMCALEGIEKRT